MSFDGREKNKQKEFKQIPIYGLNAEIIAEIIKDKKNYYLKRYSVDNKNIYAVLTQLEKQGAIELIDKRIYIQDNKPKSSNDYKAVHDPKDTRDFGDEMCGNVKFYVKGRDEKYDFVFSQIVRELAYGLNIARDDEHIYHLNITRILSQVQMERIAKYYIKLGLE